MPRAYSTDLRERALAAYEAGEGRQSEIARLYKIGERTLSAWLRILLEPESANARANAWRMASLKSFFDLLVPSNSSLSLAVYGLTSLALLIPLLRAWSRSVACLPALWAWTSLVAVLLDPHLVDYDLTVLVLAGVLAGAVLPRLRWPIMLAYLLALFRAQVPLGAVSLQLTVPLLALCALLVLEEVGRAAAPRPVSTPMGTSPSSTASSLVNS